MKRTLFLVALAVGVCTPAILAQETAKSGIYGGIQNLRLNVQASDRQDSRQETAKAAINGGLQNLLFDTPATKKEEVISLPSASKSTLFSAIPTEIAKQYPQSLPLNSSAAGSRVQCPPSCPSDDYNRVEIYAGYSLLSRDFRLSSIVDDDIGLIDNINLANGFNLFDNRNRFHLHGVDVSVTLNFSRYIGAQFDFSAHRRNIDDFNLLFFNDVNNDNNIDNIIFAGIRRARLTTRNFLFGVQVKDNLQDGYRVRPFGHFLVGFSRNRPRIEDVTLISDFDNDGDLDTILFDGENRFRRTSFALAIGGGFDIRVSDHVSIRAIKFDYLPVFARRQVVFLDSPIITDPDLDFQFFDNDDDRFERRTQRNFRIGAGIVFHF